MIINSRKIRTYVFLLYFWSIILLWSFKPFYCDILGLINLLLFLRYKYNKGNLVLLSFILYLFSISILSYQTNNILFVLRYIYHIILIYLGLKKLATKFLIKNLKVFHIVVFFISLVYMFILTYKNPYAGYTLGFGLFVGAKNHFSYFLIGNFLLILYLGNLNYRDKIILYSVTIVGVVLSRSATGFIALGTVILLYNVKKLFNNKIKKKSIGISFLLIIFVIGIIFANKNIFVNVLDRILHLNTDPSWLIRKRLFSDFNSIIMQSDIKTLFFGNGNFLRYNNRIYDNSFYAIFMGGGITLSFIFITLILRNLLILKFKSFYIIFMIYNFIFFISANVFFEIQNLFPLIFLITFVDIVNKSDFSKESFHLS